MEATDRTELAASGGVVLLGIIALVANLTVSKVSFDPVDALAAGVPTAILSVALAISAAGGGLDIAAGGLFALVISAFAVRPEIGIIELGIAVIAVAVIGAGFGSIAAISRHRMGLVVMTYLLFRSLATALFEVRSTSAPTADAVLGALSRDDVVPPLVLLAAIVAGATALLYRTQFGLRLRAYGQSRSNAARLGYSARSIEIPLRATVAGIAGLAAGVAVAQAGIAGPRTGDTATIVAVSAVTIGSAGFATQRPNVVRVAVASVLLSIIRQELASGGWQSSQTDVAVIALALLTAVVGTLPAMGKRDHQENNV